MPNACDVEMGMGMGPDAQCSSTSKLSLRFAAVQKIALVWHNVQKYIDIDANGEALKRQILFDVSGVAKPGEMVALMGPSGSGKTTLLNILGGRGHSNLKGKLQHNCESFQKSMRRRVAYVLQEDIFFEELTVRQQLHITSQLRLPGELSLEKKRGAVDNVLEALHIRHCADTKIKVISGGERKRCNIGTELLTNPSIILLDEPTSGLDSSAAHSLIQTLREMALQDMTILCAIHQPSSRIFYEFDKLLLLVDGHTVYFGPPQKCLQYFAQLGLYPPCDYNPADFVMDLLNGAGPPPAEHDSSSHAALSHNVESNLADGYQTVSAGSTGVMLGALVVFEGQHEGCHDVALSASVCPATQRANDMCWRSDTVSPTPSASSSECTDAQAEPSIRSRLIAAWDSSAVDNACKPYMQEQSALCSSGEHLEESAVVAVGEEMKFQATYYTQFITLFHRSLLISGHSVFSTLQIAQTVSVALLCGVCWWDMEYSENRVDDRAGFIFFFMTFWFYLNLYQGLLQFHPERTILLKERAAGSYRLSAYYLSKMASELPVKLTLPFIFLLISFPMASLSNSVPVFLGVCGVQLLCALAGESIGLFMGTVSLDIMRALIVGNFISLTLTLAGGYYVTNLPVFVSWIKYLSPFKFSYDACLKLTFNRRIPCEHGEILVTCANDAREFATPEDVWRYLGAEGSIELNCLFLILFIVFFRIMAYLSLRFISHNNGRK